MRTCLLAIIALALFAPLASAADLPGFVNTWDEAVKLAKQQNKPIFLHFTTDTCVWCRKIEAETYPTELGRKVLAGFVPATLDCTVEPGKPPTAQAKLNLQLAARFGGGGYPFLVIVTPEGAMLNASLGYTTPEKLAANAEEAMAVLKQLRDLEAGSPATASAPTTAASRPGDLERQVQAMRLYAKVRLWPRALEAAAAVRKLDAGNEKGYAIQASFITLEAARAEALLQEKPEPAVVARQEALLEEIRKADPKNEHTVLEQALYSQAMFEFDRAHEAESELGVKQHLVATAKLMAELTEKAGKMENAQRNWVLLGNVYGLLDQTDQAKTALEKAFAADPNSPMAGRIRQVLDKLGAASAPATGASTTPMGGR